LKGTHPGTIPARFGLIWFSGFRGEDLNVICYQNMPNLHNRYISAERKFQKSSPRKLLSQYQPNFTEMILGWPPSKTVSVDPDFQPRWPPSSKSSSLCLHSSNLGTFWLNIEQFWPFEEISIFSNSGHLVAFKIVSDSHALHSRWPLLLKIEISSNGQNCSILSQNVPKFELCKHNDELFSTDTVLEGGHPRIISVKFG
jgi:hypothetical protein